MNIDFRKIVVTILSIVVAVLGGNQYQQFSTLNDIQKNIKTLAEDGKMLAKTVDSVAHRDFTRFESE